jgi:hypothetical protein
MNETPEDPELARLLSGLALHTDFSLHLVLCDSFPSLVEAQRRVQAFEVERGRSLRVIAPNGAEDQRHMISRLVSLGEEEGTSRERATVVLWPQLSSDALEEAWRTICRLLNERREWFRNKWPHALLVFGGEKAHDILRDEAVDLWSIRTGTYALAARAPKLDPAEIEADLERAERLIARHRLSDVDLGLNELLRIARRHLENGEPEAALPLATRASRIADELGLEKTKALALRFRISVTGEPSEPPSPAPADTKRG